MQKKFRDYFYLIMSYLRHLSEEDAFETLEQSLPYKHLIKSGRIRFFGEKIHLLNFKSFAASVKEGYKIVAHAGEEGICEYVWEALDLLKSDRIDHGNNSLTDEKLVNYLVETKWL